MAMLPTYNHIMTGGKWNHMMDQVHIGYTYWNDPKESIRPETKKVEAEKTIPYRFVEKDGYVSIEAAHYTHAINGNASWTIIPDFGKTLSGITTMPVIKDPTGMSLEYEVECSSTGNFVIEVLTAPTLNFNKTGLSYAISFGDESPQIVNINGKYTNQEMEKWEAQSINKTRTTFNVSKAGLYKLKIKPLNPGIVFEKFMIDFGGLKPSYLGAPETL